MKIVVLEDYVDLLQELVFMLQHAGHEVRGARCIAELEGVLEGFQPDVLLLDADLPDGDGLALAAQLSAASALGIVMLSGKGSAEHRVRALNCGIDHYLTKPTGRDELLAVLERLYRRIEPRVAPAAAAVAFAGWTLDLSRQALLDPSGTQLRLTPGELVLLEPLMRAAGRPVERTSLIAALGEDAGDYDHRRLEVRISRLRSKLRAASGEPVPLRAQWGAGYVFTATCRVLAAPSAAP
ncbi:Response regulator protein GraR [Thauera sp. GDN1]|uniref:response regulator transcription factor n=1 Tax=Thauera sp. GDN1 TaxID=2944810 RepID=UPI00247963D4|nr:response regulator transcription factor [Thauera sp. GDN1]WEN42081.1 Response regulator protein GraR [Thauera sp. GDN1]